MDQHYQDLISFVESEKCVTSRWLSVTLNVQATESIQLLEKYQKESTGICSFYTFSVVSPKDNALSIILVNEAEMKEAINNLKLKDSSCIVSAPQIYCVSKQKVNNQIILSQDREQASELLFMKHHNSELFINNKYGLIKLPSLVVKPLGERVVRATSTSTTASDIPAKESAEAHINRMFSNRTAVPESKSKPAAAVTSFFAKQSGDKKESEVKESISSKPIEEESKPPVADNIIETKANTDNKNINDEDDGEEAEWDDGTEKKDKKKETKKKVKETTKKTKESESEEPTEVEIEVEKKKKSHQPVPKVIQRGAMDDYMEDIKNNHDALESSSSGINIEIKKKKKKLVEKMFSDEKGYLVTEMVWEEMTDDESEIIPSSATSHGLSNPSSATGGSQNVNNLKRSNQSNDDDVQAKKANTNNTSSNNTNKTKKVAPTTTGQKSMMSFFAKK